MAKKKSYWTGLLLIIWISSAAGENLEAPKAGPTYDIVINSGRVIDPETALDAIRHIGITGDSIVAVDTEVLVGKRMIDASGLVVSPGFIDLHAHGQSYAANTFQAHDGVTTALELEAGALPVSQWLAARAGNALINYGASVSHIYARIRARNEYPQAVVAIAESSNYLPLSAEQTSRLGEIVGKELDSGAIGIGVLGGYTPGSTFAEYRELFEVAAEHRAPLFVHVRDPDLDSIDEVLGHAESTGASLHIVHINSMALRDIETAIDRVESAVARGFDVTSELYPYTAASTYIESPFFDEGWRKKFGADYADIQLQETGERLNERTFREYRERGGAVILHMMREDWIRHGLSRAQTLIASDGMPYAPGAHPRSAGTFARLLGKYVREDRALTLPQAIEKITLLPARRLETVVPAARQIGRIQPGANADITIFDPETIIDRATFEDGLKFSTGVEHVIVNGTLVIDGGETVADVFPGTPLSSVPVR